jgi:hypothetical protein
VDGDPEVIFCAGEFGPLNLQPRPGRHWAAIAGKNKEPGRPPRPGPRATCTRPAGVRHLSQGEQRRDRLHAGQRVLVKPHSPFTTLRYFALDGTGHASHEEQASMIRRYITWRNNHAYDERLRRIIDLANVA